MPFGKDYEYAQSASLPWWLRNFADQQLEKKGNPFDDIKELFKNKSESDSVEIRVSELRERVGLDAIEKVASGEKDKIPGGKAKGQSDEKYDPKQMEKGVKVEVEHTPDKEVAKEITKDHLEESEDFKNGKGGKYYDKLIENEKKIEKELSKKKAALIVKLISIANNLDSKGFTKAAQYVDDRIQVLAKEVSKNYVGDIEKDTEKNKFFRKVLFTGKHAQLVVMAVQGGDELGSEVHEKVDQFFRIEEGEAIFVLDGKKKKVKAGGGVVIAAGTEHNVINASKTEVLKLYTVYSPPNHPPGTIHKTKEDADKAEKEEKKASFNISKRAEMDRLPIAADPVLWSDEQLAEVVKTPHLMEELEKKPELLKAVLEQVSKRKGAQKGLAPKDIGHWMERGWFGLFEMHRGGSFLGLWKNKDAAEMARQRIIQDFAEGGDDSLAPYDEEELTQTLLYEAMGEYKRDSGQSFNYGTAVGKTDVMRGDAEKFADEFMNHPFYAERRKKLIESATKVIKMPQNFEPEGDPSVKGGIPTGEDIEKARNAWWAHQDSKEPDPTQDNMQEWEEWMEKEPYHQEMDEVTREFNKAYDDIIVPAAKQIAKKQKMRDDGIDPKNMVDDVRLSCRHGYKLSKRAIKWYAPTGPQHIPGQWQDFKLPPGAGTMLKPKTEEETWEAGKTREVKVEKPEIKGPEIKEPEAPKETGKEGKTWYLLMACGQGLGWYKDRRTAEAVRGEMINDFERDGVAGETPFAEMFNYNMGPVWSRKFQSASKEAEEIYNFMKSSAQIYRDERDLSASDILEIFEITTDFEPEYVIGEDESPTGDFIDIDNSTFSGMGRQYSEGHPFNKMPKDVGKAIGHNAGTRKKVLDNIVEWATERVNQADDFYISRRAEQLAEDKTPKVLKDHPKLENFIRNVCRTRGGYIEVPAIQNMIRNERKEEVDVTGKELVEFIKSCLKEYKEEMVDESDEHDGEYTTSIQTDDDDGNKEVFSKPPTNI